MFICPRVSSASSRAEYLFVLPWNSFRLFIIDWFNLICLCFYYFHSLSLARRTVVFVILAVSPVLFSVFFASVVHEKLRLSSCIHWLSVSLLFLPLSLLFLLLFTLTPVHEVTRQEKNNCNHCHAISLLLFLFPCVALSLFLCFSLWYIEWTSTQEKLNYQESLYSQHRVNCILFALPFSLSFFSRLLLAYFKSHWFHLARSNSIYTTHHRQWE